MSTLESAYLSGYAGYFIAVPLLRLIASLFMAAAVVKDCKARKYNYRWIAVIAVYFSPILSSVAYFIYSRFIDKRIVNKIENRKRIKSAKRFCFLSVFTYIISVLIVISAGLTVGISGLTSVLDDEILFPCYDINGNEYRDSYDVPIYDEEGNSYFRRYSDDSWFEYFYIDRNSNKFSSEKSYITEDGYFFYDSDNDLDYCDEDGYYYDAQNNRYAQPDFNIYWDNNGDIWVDQGKSDCRLFD